MQSDTDFSPSDFNSDEKRRAAYTSTMVSVAVNIVLTVLQIAVGFFAKSQSLIADGVHSLSDLLADFVVLFVNRFSHLDADANHHYGHARFENAASLLLGALLLAVGVGMLWSAGVKITQPEEIPAVHPVALWVAVLTLLSKEGLFRYMLAVAHRVKSGMLVANAWHARSDAASSLVVALGIGGNLLGYKFLDPLAAALVGFMVARMGWKFGWSALSDLMDRGLTTEEVESIRATLITTPGVRDVHDLRTRRMGDYPLIDAHLLVDGRISVSEGHYIAALARARVLSEHKALDVLLHIDPEDDKGHSTVAALPHRARVLQVVEEALGPELSANIRLQLHYLNGSIEIDATLDPSSCLSDDDRLELQRKLETLVRDVAELRTVRVHRTLLGSIVASPDSNVSNGRRTLPGLAD